MKKALFIALPVLLALAVWCLFVPRTEEACAVISGTVSWTAAAGAEVEEGSELVRIRSLTGGEIAAARSSGKGRVVEVLVQPGDELVKNKPVARIEKKH